jgi:hypothetical protein
MTNANVKTVIRKGLCAGLIMRPFSADSLTESLVSCTVQGSAVIFFFVSIIPCIRRKMAIGNPSRKIIKGKKDSEGNPIFIILDILSASAMYPIRITIIPTGVRTLALR